MNKYIIKITLESDALIGSGESYGALIDSDVVYDDCGLPYIPAKRIKGLLKFSLESICEMFETSGIKMFNRDNITEIFGKKGNDKSSEVMFSNLYVGDYDANRKAITIYMREYPDFISKDIVVNYFTSVRHQIEINKNGTTKDKSLRTIRVLNKGAVFFGEIYASEEQSKLLSLACRNLRYLGTKRNKGFGFVRCELSTDENEEWGNIWNNLQKELEESCKN